jgi:SAM-dependent methyltransferase
MTTYVEIADLLVCPRCRSVLREADPGTLRCTGADCPYATRGFAIVHGCAVLVDFERSVLEERQVAASGAATLVRRRPRDGWRRSVRDILFGRNRAAARAARAVLAHRPARGGTPLVLVVGGATVGAGADELYDAPGVRVVGFDVYRTEHTTFVADAHSIPLADGSVSAVWVQAVLEHVLDPAAVVQEIWRVLEPDGVVYAETPFMQQVHEGPYDFTRFTHSGHRWLFRDFAELDSGVVAGPGTQLSWTIDHAVRSATRSPALGKLAKALCFWVRALDAIAGPRFALDAASGLYFLGRRSTRPMNVKEIVGYYRGAGQ